MDWRDGVGGAPLAVVVILHPHHTHLHTEIFVYSIKYFYPTHRATDPHQRLGQLETETEVLELGALDQSEVSIVTTLYQSEASFVTTLL